MKLERVKIRGRLREKMKKEKNVRQVSEGKYRIRKGKER